MKKLVLMRHAHAQQNQNGGDKNRGLSDRGIQQLNDKIELFKKLGVDLWLHSDARRTTETCHFVAEKVEGSEIKALASLYAGDYDTYLNAIASIEESIEVLGIVGHNPTISDLYYHLAGHPLGFETCQVETLSLTGDTKWQLIHGTLGRWQ